MNHLSTAVSLPQLVFLSQPWGVTVRQKTSSWFTLESEFVEKCCGLNYYTVKPDVIFQHWGSTSSVKISFKRSGCSPVDRWWRLICHGTSSVEISARGFWIFFYPLDNILKHSCRMSLVSCLEIDKSSWRAMSFVSLCCLISVCFQLPPFSLIPSKIPSKTIVCVSTRAAGVEASVCFHF